MRGVRSTLLVTAVVALVVALAALESGGASAQGKACDPESDACVLATPVSAQAYHAAFPDFSGPEDRVTKQRIHAFERAAGRRIAWAYFSDNWFRGRIRFPTEDVEAIDDAGRTPFVRLMARSSFGRGRDPNFSMRSIAQGQWDAELEEWCSDARDAGLPLLAEFGTEVNGDWFPWNGRWNGAGRTGWGDPAEADGPERFRAAYRRVVETCREMGADDITWFFHIDVGGWPRTSWNQPWDYYPGDEYVDWIGLSDYGPLRPGEPWKSFHSRMDRVLYDLFDHVGTDKPLAVLEYGAAATPREQGRKASWISQAAELVARGHWPEIRALSYWHEAWINGNGVRSNLHIDSSNRVRRAYRQAVDGPRFASRTVFEPR